MKFTNKVIEDARDEYLKYNCNPPRQFNIAFSKINGWSAEFCEEEEEWNCGTTWISGDEVLNLFFSCDSDKVNLDSWEESYNDEEEEEEEEEQ